jgi:hypothetical protein
MPQPVMSECPLCKGRMEVTEMACGPCDVQVRGHFTLSRFDQLTSDHLQFLEAFLRCRGVIRDVEAMLGISYPTVRGRLDNLLTALDFDEAKSSEPFPDKAARRKEILAAISTGEIDAETGLDALSQLA